MEHPLVYFTAICYAALIIAFYRLSILSYQSRFKIPMRYPPGPAGVPFLQNLLDVSLCSEFWRRLQDWEAIHGEFICPYESLLFLTVFVAFRCRWSRVSQSPGRFHVVCEFVRALRQHSGKTLVVLLLKAKVYYAHRIVSTLAPPSVVTSSMFALTSSGWSFIMNVMPYNRRLKDARMVSHRLLRFGPSTRLRELLEQEVRILVRQLHRDPSHFEYHLRR